MKPAGQIAVVTGGGSGLGAATARALTAKGCRVAVLDIDLASAKVVADAIGGLAVECDVASEDRATRALAEVKARQGIPRILINCAGIGEAKRIVGRQGPMPLAEFERVIRINLVGTFNMMRLCAAGMIAAEPLEDGDRGVIVSTASVAGYEGQIGQAAYAASKGGIISLTLPAAREFAQFGVRVLALAPGLFETPLLKGLSPEAQASLADAIPYPHRLGSPDEFAHLVIACIENKYLNGEVIRLDGALRMGPQ